MDDMYDFFCFCCVLIGGVALFGFGICNVADVIEARSCAQFEKQTGRPTKWVYMDSCYVTTTGGVQRLDEYLARSTTNE